jgi:anaerobic magnesium-protoporphyrin IX monomethyl ester cyclase
MRVLWPVYKLHKEENQYPGIMVLSSLLKLYGFEVEVVNAQYEEVKSRLSAGERAVLAYSTPTSFFRHYLELNRQLKQDFPEVLSVFGGPHPTFFPEIVEEEGVDAICIGEGEYCLLELAQAWLKRNPLHSIPNLWVKADGRIYRNPLRPLLEDLNQLPLPDHNIFWKASGGTLTHAVVLTSRGCPHSCTYCYNHVYRQIYKSDSGKMVRRRSVAHVIAELREIKKQGREFIRFMDDLFILSADWIHEFSGRYREEIGLPFSCLARANYVTPEIVASLKKAGCYRMLIGVEAGSERVRNQILRRNMSEETVLRAAETIRSHRIKLVTASILAVPGGGIEDDLKTLELNIRCRPDFASAALLVPFPRTEIHDFARNGGWLTSEGDLSIESSFGFGFTSPLRFREASEKHQMENLQKFFPLTVKFPRLLPLVRRLIRLRPNLCFLLIYRASIAYGAYTQFVTPVAGLKMLFRRFIPGFRSGTSV